MNHVEFRPAENEDILWLLEQIRGLADALRLIHDLSSQPVNSGGSNLPPPAKNTRRSGWHHDIKPENILCFALRHHRYSSLRIADFGSSKIQTYRSGSIHTQSPNGTKDYEPPEAISMGKTSRRYDVWSLGCVFLEILVWALEGFQAVKLFKEKRNARRCPSSLMDIVIDCGFWQMAENNDTRVRASVVTCIQDLRQVESQPRQQPFEKVLDLVERMLDPDPATRILALDAWTTLDNIYRQKKVDLDKGDDDTALSNNQSRRPSVRLSTNPPDRRSPDQSPQGEPVVNHGYASNNFLTASPLSVSPRYSVQQHRRNSSASDRLSPGGGAGGRSRNVSNASSSLSESIQRRTSGNMLAPNAPGSDLGSEPMDEDE